MPRYNRNNDMRRALPAILAYTVVTMWMILVVAAQTQPAPPQKPDDIPVTDGTSGPCSIEFAVTDSDGKPVYAARIDVHLAYGVDMGVYTNAQGKARFTGIPAKVRKPPIEFNAKKDDLVGVAAMDPATECQAKHDIVMVKKP